ncbi:sacsin N-terminal ATP-binding-like domain-containing protein [Cellulomonas alba]|uniref:ATP-binding protein n=1 Tax=Cellulomonas alba TaxID=3053467 RepID=A0ABT7SGX2_9CELL|nr:ATP-binding protein [Cellulomonas alba]MDM7855448.1 ATP-binding protein [Cellulomonas alba]
MTPDPFGTAALRAAVLGAWRASPARLREDANVEEDHARGYYRDRVVVELAQNAADAATRAGVPGRLLLRLGHTDDGRAVLVAANTGEPLDAEGVASLASMRASSKRAGDGIVGRFGVGFAAVRAVADEVSVLSTSGGVRFSLRDTAALLAEAAAEVPALEDEVRRRDGSLPALRLPLPADGRPPTGYDTAVVLELRDEVAFDEVAALLAAVDDALLLALAGLTEVVVEAPDGPGRRLADVGARWVVASAEGELPLALLADRPVEERAARAWRVTIALPRDPAAARADLTRLHAPTPTDERSSLPVLVVATLPLDPTRRHVARGALTDALLDHVAGAYAALARLVADTDGDVLALAPTGFAAGEVDGDLRARVLRALAATPLLVPAAAAGGLAGADAGTAPLVPPARAVAIEGAAGRDAATLRVLGEWVAGLVRVPPGREPQARSLGVEVRPLADVVDELPALPDPRWSELYGALAPLADDPRDREALAGLPVPLADGRVVRGARGALVVDADVAAALDDRTFDALARLGLRIVDPAAAGPLLERLGATAADAAALLTQPAVRAAVLAAADDDEPDPEVTHTVLALVAAAREVPPDARPWLGLLTLTAADGEPTPADGLVLPGSAAARLLDERVLAPVALELVDRWDADTLAAVGVRRELVVLRVADVLADPASADDPDALAAQSLDGWEEYLEHLADTLGAGAYVGDASAVADLDAVAPGAWPEVLARIAGEPELRRVLVEPVRGEGGGVAGSYTAWWLRERADLGLGAPFLVGSGLPVGGAADPAAALVPPPPATVAALDGEVQRALGGVEGLAELDGAAWTRLLDEWEVGTPVAPALAVLVWRHAAPADPPEHVPALVAPGRIAVVHAQDAAVADGPMWWQRTDVAAVVPCLARDDAVRAGAALDLPLMSAIAPGRPDEPGVDAPVPAAAAELVAELPATWREHDDLLVDGVPVEWWVDADGLPHATSLAGLAAALAQAAGRWSQRAALEAVLLDPARVAELALDAAWGAPDA